MAYCPTQTVFLLTVNSICLSFGEVVRRQIRWPISRHKGTVVGAVLCLHANNYIIYLYTFIIIFMPLIRAKIRVRENRFCFFLRYFCGQFHYHAPYFVSTLVLHHSMSVIILNDGPTVLYRNLEPETETLLQKASPGTMSNRVRKPGNLFYSVNTVALLD